MQRPAIARDDELLIMLKLELASVEKPGRRGGCDARAQARRHPVALVCSIEQRPTVGGGLGCRNLTPRSGRRNFSLEVCDERQGGHAGPTDQVSPFDTHRSVPLKPSRDLRSDDISRSQVLLGSKLARGFLVHKRKGRRITRSRGARNGARSAHLCAKRPYLGEIGAARCIIEQFLARFGPVPAGGRIMQARYASLARS